MFQGNCQSPVSKPKKVVGLDNMPIHQISAGTSHSVAWTAIPTDRKVIPEYLKLIDFIIVKFYERPNEINVPVN